MTTETTAGARPPPPMTLRPYQQRILNAVGESSVIIDMPRGAGKTVTAAHFIQQKISAVKDSNPISIVTHQKKVILFLAKNADIVSAKTNVIQQWTTGCNVVAIDGTETETETIEKIQQSLVMSNLDVLVTTLKVFLSLQSTAASPSPCKTILSFPNLAAIVCNDIDTLRMNPLYRNFQLELAILEDACKPQFIGLTSALSQSRQGVKVKVKLKEGRNNIPGAGANNVNLDKNFTQLFHELSLVNIECLTEEEEMQWMDDDDDDDDDLANNPNTNHSPNDDKRDNDNVHVMMDPNAHEGVPPGVVPPSQRDTNHIYAIFMKRIGEGNATPFAMQLYTVVHRMETAVKRIVPLLFESPLVNPRMLSWEEYAHSLNAKILQEGGGGGGGGGEMKINERSFHHLHDFLLKLERWYVALRMLVKSWEEDMHLVLYWLKLNGCCKPDEYWFDCELCEAVVTITAYFEKEENFGKLCCLKKNLGERFEVDTDTSKPDKNFLCIILTKERITGYILNHFINEDYRLQSKGIKSGFIVSTAKKLSPSTKSLNQTEQRKVLNSVKCGEINVLVTTCITDEIQELNITSVIVYDCLRDIALFRQQLRRETNFILMNKQHTNQHHETTKEIAKKSSVGNTTKRDQTFPGNTTLKILQAKREKDALHTIMTGKFVIANPLSAMHVYAQKTRGTLHELKMERVDGGTGGGGGVFECTLEYRSLLRIVQGHGRGVSKKQSKQKCSDMILKSIAHQIGIEGFSLDASNDMRCP